MTREAGFSAFEALDWESDMNACESLCVCVCVHYLCVELRRCLFTGLDRGGKRRRAALSAANALASAHAADPHCLHPLPITLRTLSPTKQTTSCARDGSGRCCGHLAITRRRRRFFGLCRHFCMHADTINIIRTISLSHIPRSVHNLVLIQWSQSSSGGVGGAREGRRESACAAAAQHRPRQTRAAPRRRRRGARRAARESLCPSSHT